MAQSPGRARGRRVPALRLLLLRETKHLVGGPANLERASLLQVFSFQVDRRANQFC